jgi:glutamine phosphoribosylpyrophosphate amidotransferase
VDGAYSLIVAIGDTLLAARDPRGWRPLAMGQLGDAVVFASETCALDIIGATYLRDVEPGEIVSANGNGITSMQAFPSTDLRRCVFEYVYFARPDSRVFGGSVNLARRALGRRLAQEWPAPNADLVFSVPDSSNSAALGFAEEKPPALTSWPSFEITTSAARSFSRPRRARCQGEGQVQPGSRGPRRQERRDGGRLDRSADDYTRAWWRSFAPRGARGPSARQLLAGHGTVLLRNRYTVA